MTNLRIANRSGFPFTGWRRRNIDDLPVATGGSNASGTRKFLIGNQSGLDTKTLCYYVSNFTDGSVEAVDLTSLTAAAPTPVTPTPTQIAERGTAVFAGKVMTLISSGMNGMFYEQHWRTRSDNLPGNLRGFVCDVWIHWVPGQGWAEGTVSINYSDPTIPDMKAVYPTGLNLTFNGTATAKVFLPGRGLDIDFFDANGDHHGNGQKRVFPIVVNWLELAGGQANSIQALRTLRVGGIAIKTLWPGLGNPNVSPTFNPNTFLDQHWATHIGKLYNWQETLLGIRANGHLTGGEGDEVFTGGEMMASTACAGIEELYRIIGMIAGRRPCHFCEADGSLLTFLHNDTSPGAVEPTKYLQIWEGQPQNYNNGSSLGKPWDYGVPNGYGRPPEEASLPGNSFSWFMNTISHNWWGPWSEHYFINGLSCALRVTGDEALDDQLQHHMRQMYYGQANTPDIRTSALFWAERAEGWWGYAVRHMYRNLQSSADRAWMLSYINTHLAMKYDQLTTAKATYGNTGVLKLFFNASSLQGSPNSVPPYDGGTGRDPNWITYQYATLHGLWLAAKDFGHAGLQALAAQAIYNAFDRSWDPATATDAFPPLWDFQWFDQANPSHYAPLVERDGAHRAPYSVGVWQFWLLAIPVLLQEYPNYAKAKAAATFYLEKSGGYGIWWVPGTQALMNTLQEPRQSKGAFRDMASGTLFS